MVCARIVNGTESTYAYDRQRERLQGMLLTANRDSIMQTQYKYDPVDNILGISDVITPKAPMKPKGSEGRAVWIALTLYPAPILSVTRRRFTKHYFIGDRRVASKIGAGIFQNAYGHGANVVTAGQKDYQMRMMQIEKQREDYYRKLGTPPGVPPMKGATAEPENTHVGIFYFHTDHLGITSYITDAKANVAQFNAYLPYDELLVDEHSSSEEMPYKFNGKEFDEETGLYYYGARYMNPRTSLWYGVDILREKYPTVGGQVYCAGNPISLIDPDGRQQQLPDVWKTITPVISKDKFIGWGNNPFYNSFKKRHNREPNCLDYSKEQLRQVGYTAGGAYDTSNLYPYNEGKSVNKVETKKAITYMMSALQKNIPVLIGVDDAKGSPNPDNTTDHFLVVVGMGHDKGGNYFLVYDNATGSREEGTSKNNKLYYDPRTEKISGRLENGYAQDSPRAYTITQVRISKKIKAEENKRKKK